jgi:hypothetical protein
VRKVRGNNEVWPLPYFIWGVLDANEWIKAERYVDHFGLNTRKMRLGGVELE